jgi:hypothetical protein
MVDIGRRDSPRSFCFIRAVLGGRRQPRRPARLRHHRQSLHWLRMVLRHIGMPLNSGAAVSSDHPRRKLRTRLVQSAGRSRLRKRLMAPAIWLFRRAFYPLEILPK